MTSDKKITGGPGKAELIDAIFFAQDLAPQFVLDNGKYIMGEVVCYVPCASMEQMVIIAIRHSPERGKKAKTFIRYDMYTRKGELVEPQTIEELTEWSNHR